MYPRENTIPATDTTKAANQAAVATFSTPGTDHRLRIRYIFGSYSGVPTGGKVTISDGTTTWEFDVTAAGPFYLPHLDIQTAPNHAVTVTLAAAGAAVVGKINAYAVME